MKWFSPKTNKAFLTLILNLAFAFTIAQTPEIIEVSRQELPTSIRSQTTDDEGNTYYAGVFRGALVINNDTLAFGKGGDDYFIIRQSMAGNIDWVIPIGGEQEDNRNIFVLFHKGSLYATFGFENPVSINETSIQPMQQASLTNCLIKINSSGNLIWHRLGNIINTQLHPLNESIITVGNIPATGSEAIYNSNIIYPQSGFNITYLQKINSSGDLVDLYPIFNKNAPSSQISTLLRINTKKNQLYFLLAYTVSGTQTGFNALSFNGQEIANMPNQFNSTILVKTDTSFKVKATKILNPNGSAFFSGSHTENRIQFSSDSLKLNLLVNFGTYNVDGYNENLMGKFGIAILDTNLITSRIKIFYEQSFIESQRKVSCQYVKEYEGNFFIFGTLVGNKKSNSPISIPENIIQIQLAANKIIPFDINGPSKNFILKTDTSFEYINHTWIGDNTVQEISTFPLESFNITDNYIRFFQIAESTFNPWIVSIDGNIVRGSAKPVADNPDYPVNVAYFTNKSKIILGQTHGLNAFDPNANGIVKSRNRNDFFFAVVDSNHQLKKYVRLFGTFSNSGVIKTKTRNDSVYALVQIFSPNNPLNNNITLDTFQITINTSRAVLLLAIHASGNFSVRNFTQTPIGDILDFDLFNNGDFALLSNSANIAYNHNGQQFPANHGFYVARMNSQGILLQAMKVYGVSNGLPQPRGILVEDQSDNFTINMLSYLPSGGGNVIIATARNGSNNTYQSFNIPVPVSSQVRGCHLFYKANFINDKNLSFIGPFSTISGAAITGIGKKTFLVYNTSSTLLDDLTFNNTLLSSVPHKNQTLILGIDDNGSIVAQNTIASLPNQVNRAFAANIIKRIGDFIYVIGSQSNDMAFGALHIKHKGNSDGLILKFDTLLNLVQFYRVASNFSDNCTDIDFSLDSNFMIAYRSQGNPSPSVGPNQVAQIQSAGIVLPSDLQESGYVSLMPSSLMPRDFVFTIKNGSWHDASVWNTGTIPVAADRVFVRHKVQISQSAQCEQLFVDPAADLKMDNGVTLTISGIATSNL